VPHHRRLRKGSFGSHFDELVKHFPDDQQERSSERDPTKHEEGKSVRPQGLLGQTWFGEKS
jgi:hypothetical protein